MARRGVGAAWRHVWGVCCGGGVRRVREGQSWVRMRVRVGMRRETEAQRSRAGGVDQGQRGTEMVHGEENVVVEQRGVPTMRHPKGSRG